MATPIQRKTQEIFYYTPNPDEADDNGVSSPDVEFSEHERAAMRAYLQRCEVRISTLHRIATAFVSGAGLLLLIPVFFKDVVDQIITVLLSQTVNQFPSMGATPGTVSTYALFILVGYPMALSFITPLYGVYLLLKDLIHFYFTVYTPGFPDTLLHPTFSLTATSFSPDESLHVKREVMRYQYESDKVNFVLPFSDEKRETYFDQMIRNTNTGIIPPNRQWAELEALGVLNDSHKAKDINRYNAALGITGSLDRTLAQEVAVTEMLLVRNIMYLRRLVLRYVKVFLMFIWTMFISFMMLPLLKDERFPIFVTLSFSYFVWSLMVMQVLHAPLNWLYRHRHDDPKPERVDAQLMLFEDGVTIFVRAAVVASILGMLLSVLAAR